MSMPQMDSLLLFLSRRERILLERECLVRFFSIFLLGMGFSSPSWSQDDPEPVAQEVEGSADTSDEHEMTEAEIEALIQVRLEKRRKARSRRNAFVGRNYTREMLALVGLFLLLLFTRKHNRDQEAHRPIRVSPVSPDELGRAIFGFVRSKDAMAFRALFLTGGEARELFGEAGVGVYLEGRSASKLETALKELIGKIPVGAQYKSCIIQEEICRLQVVGSDGQELDLAVARVALVGAVSRLVSPVDE
jgi:hypothetical protein